MDFRKKLKIRLWLAVCYIVLGVLVIIGANVLWQNILGLWGIGLGLMIVGFRNLKNYFLITKDEETIKKQQIAESDERIIAIAHKSATIAFSVYTIASAVAVIVLIVLNRFQIAAPIACSAFFLVLTYRISYFIISRRH